MKKRLQGHKVTKSQGHPPSLKLRRTGKVTKSQGHPIRIFVSNRASKVTSRKRMPRLKFNEKGLIPAIVQDYKTNEVLMLAYMNKESLKITLKEKRTCFYSRSRKVLWRKGETSGHIQKVKSIWYDCDSDTLLIKVDQTGAACHTGNRSCFYRKIK